MLNLNADLRITKLTSSNIATTRNQYKNLPSIKLTNVIKPARRKLKRKFNLYSNKVTTVADSKVAK